MTADEDVSKKQRQLAEAGAKRETDDQLDILIKQMITWIARCQDLQREFRQRQAACIVCGGAGVVTSPTDAHAIEHPCPKCENKTLEAARTATPVQRQATGSGELSTPGGGSRAPGTNSTRQEKPPELAKEDDPSGGDELRSSLRESIALYFTMPDIGGATDAKRRGRIEGLRSVWSGFAIVCEHDAVEDGWVLKLFGRRIDIFATRSMALYFAEHVRDALHAEADRIESGGDILNG
jgi:hypothetical protein